MEHETITLRIPRSTPVVQLLQTLAEAGFVLRMGADGLTGDYFPERAARRPRSVDEVLDEDSRLDLQHAHSAQITSSRAGSVVVWLHSPHWRTDRLMFDRSHNAMRFRTREAAEAFVILCRPGMQLE